MPNLGAMQDSLRHTDQMHGQHLGQRSILNRRKADVKDYAGFCLQSCYHSGGKQVNFPRTEGVTTRQFFR